MPEPTLTACIITQNMAHFLPHVLRQLVPLADEILVADGGSTDGTAELAASFPRVEVYARPFDGNMAGQKNFIIAKARCDWILVVDSDELLGDMLRARLPFLLETRKYTHYKFARYWLVGAAPYRFVKTPKHYPDYQLRLFRNLPFYRYTGRSLVHTHFPRRGRGRGQKVRDCHIFHFDFLLQDRSERAAKVRRYVTIDPPTARTTQMYLWEDMRYRIEPCQEPLTGFRLESVPPSLLHGLLERDGLAEERRYAVRGDSCAG
ncbi:MAG: glycosyltransferase family 2 protein [Planctomycetota bacterium]